MTLGNTESKLDDAPVGLACDKRNCPRDVPRSTARNFTRSPITSAAYVSGPRMSFNTCSQSRSGNTCSQSRSGFRSPALARQWSCRRWLAWHRRRNRLSANEAIS